jgi:hypothetical protein
MFVVLLLRTSALIADSDLLRFIHNNAFPLKGYPGIYYLPDNTTSISLDGTTKITGFGRMRDGFEMKVRPVPHLWLRAGYQPEGAHESGNALGGMIYGFVFHFERADFNYGWIPFDGGGGQHQVSVSFRFGK